MKYEYLFYTILGYLTGSMLFGRIVPLVLKGVDVETLSLEEIIRQCLKKMVK